MKSTTKPFRFKNRQRPSGLASVGSGTPSVDIFIGKPSLDVRVGHIDFNDHWSSNRNGITICLRYKNLEASCGWKNIILQYKPTSIEDAKDFLNKEKNREAIMNRLFIENKQS